MWNRKLTEFQVQQENQGQEKSKDVKVLNFDRVNQPEVKDFVFESLRSSGAEQYAEVKSRFGSLAATDADSRERVQKDRRFSINPLLKGPLSIKDEEQRAIAAEVNSIVAEIAEGEKKAASELGYQDGFKKGFDEALKVLQKESASKIAQFDEFLSEMENSRAEIYRINERILIEMVYRISKMLLMKDLSVDPEYLLRLAKELISKVGVRENITLKINPRDGEVIATLKEGVEKAFGHITNFNVEMSSHVKQSGIEIETEWNMINTSIETQLLEIHRSLIPDGASSKSLPPQEDQGA